MHNYKKHIYSNFPCGHKDKFFVLDVEAAKTIVKDYTVIEVYLGEFENKSHRVVFYSPIKTDPEYLVKNYEYKGLSKDRLVHDSITFDDCVRRLKYLLKNKVLLIWGKDIEVYFPFLNDSFYNVKVIDVMERASAYFDKYNIYQGNFKYPRLVETAKEFNISIPGFGLHRAETDSILIGKIWNYTNEVSIEEFILKKNKINTARNLIKGNFSEKSA